MCPGSYGFEPLEFRRSLGSRRGFDQRAEEKAFVDVAKSGLDDDRPEFKFAANVLGPIRASSAPSRLLQCHLTLQKASGATGQDGQRPCRESGRQIP